MRYVHRSAGFAGLWISLLATLAIWAGIVLMGRSISENGIGSLQKLPPWVPWTLLTAGAALAALSMTALGASVIPPSILSLAIAAALLGWQAWSRWA
jgi:hypothetical protein